MPPLQPLCHAPCSRAAVVHRCAMYLLAVVAVILWILLTIYVFIYLLAYLCMLVVVFLPSVLWRCWLGGRKVTRPVKTEWWGAGMVFCLEWFADMHMAQLMPLPVTVSCYSKIQTGFAFLVPADLGSPGKSAVKWVCVCVCVCVGVVVVVVVVVLLGHIATAAVGSLIAVFLT